jgi:hypothetical protein
MSDKITDNDSLWEMGSADGRKRVSLERIPNLERAWAARIVSITAEGYVFKFLRRSLTQGILMHKMLDTYLPNAKALADDMYKLEYAGTSYIFFVAAGKISPFKLEARFVPNSFSDYMRENECSYAEVWQRIAQDLGAAQQRWVAKVNANGAK